MKKINYLLLFLLLSLVIPLTGQSSNVNDPANKESLSQLKKVREMIMRSDNPAFKAKALKQMNEQMDELLFDQRSVAVKKFTLTNKNSTSQKSSQKFIFNNQNSQNSLKSNRISSYNEKMKVPAAGVMKYKLDSLIFYGKDGAEWVPDDKQEFAYNYNTLLTSNDMYIYDKTQNVWQDDERTTISYNEAGDVTIYYYKWWNDELQRWIEENMYTVEYNEHGDVLKHELYREEFDQDSLKFIKRGEYKEEYVYDNNFNEIANIYYIWNDETGDWVFDSKNEYLYEDDYELMFAAYQWDIEANKWVGHWKFEHQKVPGFDLLGSIYYNWDPETDSWYINSKTEYEVSTDNGVTVTETNWGLNYETGSLVYDTKSVFSNQYTPSHDLYNSFRNITYYLWNVVNSDWDLDSKTINSFDSFGNITLRCDSLWRNLNDVLGWIPDLTIESNVDVNGLITDYIVTNWEFNGMQNDMYIKQKYTNTYNTNKELIVLLQQNWDGNEGEWVNVAKEEFTYDVNGNQISHIWYGDYDTLTQQWNANRKIEWDFNPDGSEAMSAFYDWVKDTQSWKLTYKTENRIDDFGETVLEQNIQWNTYLEQEIINYKREKIYDEQRNLLSDTYISTDLFWDGSQYHMQIDGEKTENTYSASNQLLTTTEYYYTNGQFVGDDKFEYTYNTTYPAAVETEYTYSWNGATSTWEKESKGVLTSNFEVTRDDMILPFGDEGESREVKMYFSYMATELLLYQWSVTANDWVENSKVKVHFSQSEFSSVDEVDAVHMTVYPNPASDFISVRLAGNTTANIRMYDLQGRKIYESPINNQSKIDLTGLANGVYFYQIIRGHETVNGKLLKR